MAYSPREQVRGEAPLQERRWARCLLLAREELDTVRRVDVVEYSLYVHPSDNNETAVEDPRGRGVPPLLEEDEVRVLEERAALASRRGARRKQTDCLVPWLNNWVSGEPDLVSADARLQSMLVVEQAVA